MRATTLTAMLVAGSLLGQGRDDRPDRSVKDAELQSRINQAIFKGVGYLKQTQRADGSWTYERGRGGADGTGGLTALALYALAASGVPAGDPVIERGVKWCEQNARPFGPEGQYGTYSASLLVLALTRIDATKHKRWIHRLASRIAGAQLDNGQWTYRLLELGGTSARRRDRGRDRGHGPREWGPERLRMIQMRGGDNSNTQFAVLALWAAQAMTKFRVRRKVWKKIETFFERTQTESGEWTYRDPTRTAAGPADGRGAGMPRRMMEPKLTMTAAGLCSYVYAYSGQRGGVKGLDKARKTKVADRGLRAFIAKRVRWSFDNYYLVYSVERVGTVLGVPEEAWYPLGAKRLVARQQDSGRWAPPRGGGHGDAAHAYDTALALLFLSKATAYPITPRR